MEEALGCGITLIEWPERIETYPLKNVKKIRFEITGTDTRKITYDF